MTVFTTTADAHENAGGDVDDTNGLIILGGGGWYAIAQFEPTIPQGATILTAVLTITPSATNRDTIHDDLYCDDADDSAVINAGTGTSDISGRTFTTASVTHEEADVGTSAWSYPDISSLIQEVVDRPGWSSGNTLSVIWDRRAGASEQLRFLSIEDSGSDEATLEITWSAGAIQLVDQQPVSNLVGGLLVG